MMEVEFQEMSMSSSQLFLEINWFQSLIFISLCMKSWWIHQEPSLELFASLVLFPQKSCKPSELLLPCLSKKNIIIIHLNYNFMKYTLGEDMLHCRLSLLCMVKNLLGLKKNWSSYVDAMWSCSRRWQNFRVIFMIFLL